MKIIKQRIEHQSVEYSIQYHDKDGETYEFVCDSKGEVIESVLNSRGLESWNYCKNNPDVTKGEIRDIETFWVEPPVGICWCGNQVVLQEFTNTCSRCGNDYNSSGQQLAAREQWGEETGEHWTDCY